MYYSNKLDALATFFGEKVVYDGAQCGYHCPVKFTQ